MNMRAPSLDRVEQLRLDLCRSLGASCRQIVAPEAAYLAYASLRDELPVPVVDDAIRDTVADAFIRDAFLSLARRLPLNDEIWMGLIGYVAQEFPAEFDRAVEREAA